MKLKYLLFIVFFSLQSILTQAQIADEIRAFVDSSNFTVNNGRKLMVQELKARDYEKVKEIFEYLEETTKNKDFSAFLYSEVITIQFLIQDWDELLDNMWFFKDRSGRQINAEAPEIMSALYASVVRDIALIESEFEKINIDMESRRLLEIILYFFKNGSEDEIYSEMVKSYQKEYPDSRYEDFLLNFMPSVRIKASIGMSFGSGMIITTEKLAEDFSSNASFNMSFDFNIQRVFTSLYLHGASLGIINSFSIEKGGEIIDFSTEDNFQYIDAGLKGGYFLIRNKRVHLAPFLSISGSSLQSKLYESDTNRDEYKIFNSFTYGGGLHTEIKIVEFNYASAYGQPTNSYLSLKFEPGYNFIAKYKDPYYHGNNPYFIAALVWGFGDF